MIIVTTGPNLFQQGVVSELCKKGLGAIRIPASKQPPMVQINQIVSELNDSVKVIVDFPGGKFRMNNPNNFELRKGEILKLSKEGEIYDFSGKLAIYPTINFNVDVGDILVVGDGETALSVVEENDHEIVAKVERCAILGPRRGITPNNKIVKHAILTQNDYKIMECLSERCISGVMLSFVEDVEDVKKVRNYIYEEYGRKLEIYAKIETEMGIENLETIATEADYLVLARGDLLITAGEEEFPRLQHKFLETMSPFSNKAIIATELAHSVGRSYLMNRSELTFLYLLGQLGFTNLMLTSETTVLCDPVEVFEKVSKLIDHYYSSGL